MREQLSWWAVVVAAVVFGSLQGAMLVEKAATGQGLAETGIFNLGKALIAVAAIWIAIRGLRRATSKWSRHAAQEGDAKTPLSGLPAIRSNLTLAWSRRPVQLVLVFAGLGLTPIALWTSATGRFPASFGVTDWLFVGLAALPTITAIGVLLWSVRTRE